MPKLTHTDLIKVGTLLGYSSLTDGLCQGFSCMWAQALLAQDERRFFNRLRLISSYKADFKVLITDCEEAKKKVLRLDKLSKKEKQLLEIVAFFDGIEMYLNPDDHPDLFNKKYINQDNINTIYPLIKSNKLKHSDLIILLDKSHIFSKTSLTAFLYDLEERLKKSDSEFPILLGNVGHSVCLKYSKTKQRWSYIDTNNFSQYSESASYSRKLKTPELVSSIFKSLSHFSAANVLFNMMVLSRSDQPIDSIKASLTELDVKYPLTRELATARDGRQLGLLFLACQQGDLSLVQELLKHPKIKVNQAKGNGTTPLHIACQNGHHDVVAELLKHPNILINQTTSNGTSALYTATQNGHLEVIAELLKHPKIEINQRMNHGATHLYLACQNGYLDIVVELLKHPRIEINLGMNHGATPLFIACENGHLDVVVELLKHPEIMINQGMNHGATPLFIACQNGHLDVVAELLKHPNLLINQGMNKGATALFIACQNGHTKVVAELLKHRKLLINQPRYNGLTALYIACDNGHLAVVRELLKYPEIEINQADSEGITPLYVACQNDYPDIVIELLKNPSLLINQADSNGVTALHIACQKGHLDIVAELLQQPDILINQAKNNGVTPFYLACQNNHLRVVELLLKIPGIDVHTTGLTNHTPLLVACLSPHTKNNEKLFKLLLKKKVSLCHKNDNGQTALDIALEEDNTAALSVLLKFIRLYSMNPSALMSPVSLKKALDWAKDQSPEVAEYLTTYQPRAKTIKFFEALPLTNTASLNDESSAPRNSG